MAPRVARAPALSLAAPTELQRSRKQQKTGCLTPKLSGSVAVQELEQERVTTGLWPKGNSARAGRGQSQPPTAQRHPRLHAPHLDLPTASPATLRPLN